jgi:ribose transport system ATP-binding protein
MAEKILELRGIVKTYPGVTALDDITVSFDRGEVHALIGENGAGKSTLIKVISGAIRPDSGKIALGGQSYDRLDPRSSRELGVGVIYQEFNLVPALSVAENIFLGEPIRKGVVVQKKEMIERSGDILRDLRIDLDPHALVRDLSVAYKQVVEIAKAISRRVKILIMDEPSAPLTNAEVRALFDLVRNLKGKGVTVIYVSHRLEELFQIADRVTIMRDGKYVSTKAIKDTNRQDLICDMVGRACLDGYPTKETECGKLLLEVRGVSGKGIHDASLSLRAGEILGISGLVGAGRTELARAIFGADAREGGEIFLEGRKLDIRRPADAIREGIALIPEDRKLQGLLLGMSVKENISIARLKSISSASVIGKEEEKRIAEGFRESLHIKTPSMNQKARNLSGGNQQKIVLAKWLATKSKVLIFDEPTRGIDVGAKQEIYRLMRSLSAEGKGIIMISSEMPELLGLSDRIIVLCEGRIVGELGREEATQDKILDLASGQ